MDTKLTVVSSYLPRIHADLYWIEQAINKPLSEVEFVWTINRLANISYLASQAISDMTEEVENGKER
jgi:hypothetical protein